MKPIQLLLIYAFSLIFGLGASSVYGSNIYHQYDHYDCLGFSFVNRFGRLALYREKKITHAAVATVSSPVFAYHYLIGYYNYSHGLGAISHPVRRLPKASFSHALHRYRYQVKRSEYSQRLKRILGVRGNSRHVVNQRSPASSIRFSRHQRVSPRIQRSLGAGRRW
jgi:hypothetical protein